jgi:hypothetical protein
MDNPSLRGKNKGLLLSLLLLLFFFLLLLLFFLPTWESFRRKYSLAADLMIKIRKEEFGPAGG